MVQSGYGGEGPVLMAVGWTECTLGLIIIGLRLCGASKRAGEIKWDFVWIALAGVFGLASQATFALSNHYGMGNHRRLLSTDQVVLALQWIWISIFLGLVGITFAKWAIIALLLQLNGPTARKRRWFLWSTGAFLGVVCVIQFVLSFTQCNPAAKLWNQRLPGSCPGAQRALYFGFFQGASGVFVDVMLALYPISIVWGLQASTKMKIGFCVLMAGGIIPAAAGIVKTIMLDFLSNPKDITWEFAPFTTWAATELWFVIILGSVPPLRPLFVRVFRKAASTVGVSSGGTRHYGAGTHGKTTGGSHPLQSMSKSQYEKKAAIHTYTSQVMTGLDDSEENILRTAGGGNIDQIVVSTEYAVESQKRDSSMGARPADVEHGFGGRPYR